jgi:N-methylhydantoinase A
MRIAIDTGGTFTDCVFVREGHVQILKVPSQPRNPAAAIARTLEKCFEKLEARKDDSLDLVCGTTVGTNALLERRGGRVALVTTAGFEDVLEIGRQARPRLYDFFVQRPEPLVPTARRLGAAERLAADGVVLTPLKRREVRRVLKMLKNLRPDSVAVCFLFSFRNARHEILLARALRAAGYLVSVSHEILPEFREYERTSTTVINAYLAPVMSRYLQESEVQARRAFPAAKRRGLSVRVMQSNGGILPAAEAAQEPVRTILSGPAGGIIGGAYAAKLAGLDKVITFDMGGTSTDVALVSGETRTTTEAVVAGLPVAVPMLEIHTVGAGGGSIARFDRGGSLRVGPESAGAEPGPICYGRGERPTVTDAHAILGHFAGRGLLGGTFAIDVDRAYKVMRNERGGFRSVEEFAEGILAVANSVMEKAIRVISVERGHDPRDYALVAFGGVGGLHACDLAGALEMRGVLLPRFPGGLSALGILRADVVRDFSRTVLLSAVDLEEARTRVEKEFVRLEAKALRELKVQGFAPASIRLERRLDMRYTGQAYELTVPAGGDFVARFHLAHEQRYGYHDSCRAAEIVNVRCRATGVVPKPGLERITRAKEKNAKPAGSVRCRVSGKVCNADLYFREDLCAGHKFRGPAILCEYSATTLVPAKWHGRTDDYGQIFLERQR